MKKISVAIPCYNSSSFIINALIYPISDDRIDDIVISDDASGDFAELQKKVDALQSPKIRLFHNEMNFGCHRNKAIAASHAKNDWVIVFDSDNIFGKKYVDALYAIKEWNPDSIYCPESGQSLPHFSWKDFKEKIDLDVFKKYMKGKQIHINFFKKRFHKFFFSFPIFIQKPISFLFLNKKSSRFLALMNCCNYFVNKNKYLSIQETSGTEISRLSRTENIKPSGADSIFTNYFWLKHENNLKVVPGMEYYHTLRRDSYWVNTIHDYVKSVSWIVKDLDRE
jgi:glycosyltransferase involved in cell wall biosynthesis